VTVLVTGADGYIGRALVARLLQTRNDRLVLLDRQFANIHPDPRVRTLAGDFAESGTLRLATQERISARSND